MFRAELNKFISSKAKDANFSKVWAIRPRGPGFGPPSQPPPPQSPQSPAPPPGYFPIIFSQENVQVRGKNRLKFLFRKVQRKVNNVIIFHCVSLIWTPRLGQTFPDYFFFQIPNFSDFQSNIPQS